MKTITFYPANGIAPTSNSDADLLTLYRQGNDFAAAVLYARYDAPTHKAIISIAKDEPAARDIQMEVFRSALASVRDGSYTAGPDFQTYILCQSRQMATDFILQVLNEAL